MTCRVRIYDPPDLQPTIKDGLWIYRCGYVVVIDGVQYKAPMGTLTDGASVPRLLWPVVGHPFHTELILMACFHDPGYHGHLRVDGVPTALPRAEVDRLADVIMQGAIVGPDGAEDLWETDSWRRRTVYAGIRLGGWWSYDGAEVKT